MSRLSASLVIALVLLAGPACGQAPSSCGAEDLSMATLDRAVPRCETCLESYRVLVVPTFHEPFILVLERAASGWSLTSACLSGQGGYDPGVVAALHRAPVSTTVVRQFKAALPPFAAPAPDDAICLDATTWRYEHSTLVENQCVELYCPPSVFIRAGEFLSTFAPFTFTELTPQAPVSSQNTPSREHGGA